eukprot:scaffold29153_cov107-Isochrysis_galbana.AAC.9
MGQVALHPHASRDNIQRLGHHSGHHSSEQSNKPIGEDGTRAAETHDARQLAYSPIHPDASASATVWRAEAAPHCKRVFTTVVGTRTTEQIMPVNTEASCAGALLSRSIAEESSNVGMYTKACGMAPIKPTPRPL